MTDFLIVEDEDMDFVWKTIQDNRLFSIQTLPLKGNSTTPSFCIQEKETVCFVYRSKHFK